MGPVATGLGEVYHYLLTSEDPEYDLAELRTLQDWVDPPAAPARARRRRGQRLGRAREAVRGPGRPAEARQVRPDARRPDRGPRGRTTRTSAAATSSASGESSLVQGVGRVGSRRRDRRRSSSRRIDGVPIRVKDVAEVASATRSAAAASPPTARARSVLGLAFMLMGENSREVTMALDAALDDVKQDPAPRRRRSTWSTSGPTWSTRSSRPSSGTCSRGRSSSSPCSSPSSGTSGPG